VRAEARADLAEERLAAAEIRIVDLVEQVAVLSRMLFGRSSEKQSASAGWDDPAGSAGQDEAGNTGEAGEGDGQQEDSRPKRGQRPGSRWHGRRNFSHLDSREEIHDVPAGQRVCRERGLAFKALVFDKTGHK
jgi:hypothetical protein